MPQRPIGSRERCRPGGLLLALGAWALASVGVSLLLGRFLRLGSLTTAELLGPVRSGELEGALEAAEWPLRVLLVEDDPAMRTLLATTLAADMFAVKEAGTAREARELAHSWRPAVAVLDVGLPDGDGLDLCAELKRSEPLAAPLLVLLTGADVSAARAEAAGAEALLGKPFSPLELVRVVERLAGRAAPETTPQAREQPSDQLLLYARDLNRLLTLEREQRLLLEESYRGTAAALASALEARDSRTGSHSARVHAYARELCALVDPTLLDDQGLDAAFLLHDIGKLAIPDRVLQKPGPLDRRERQLVERHPLIGAEILAEVPLLRGKGLELVRSHHERWSGSGYPDGLAGSEIPLSARIFSLADALDAITSDRPYRSARAWREATEEIIRAGGSQFDPEIVEAFREAEPALHELYRGRRAA